MRRLTILTVCLVLLASCKTRKQEVPVLVENTVTKVERVTEMRWDTVYMEVPSQSAEVTTRDSISHLETDFALSDARVDSFGTLYHTLRNKPQSRPQTVPVTVQRTDSITEREVQVPVYMERQLSRYDKMRQSAFWWLVAYAVAITAFALRKTIYRFFHR